MLSSGQRRRVLNDYQWTMRLLKEGIREDHVRVLFELRTAVRQGQRSEWLRETDADRLAFARWLYEQGRLQP